MLEDHPRLLHVANGSLSPDTGRLAIHAFEFAAELGGALIAHVPSGFEDGSATGNFHCGSVQSPRLDELQRGQRGSFLESTMEHGPAHVDMRGHVVDADRLVQMRGQIVDGPRDLVADAEGAPRDSTRLAFQHCVAELTQQA